MITAPTEATIHVYRNKSGSKKVNPPVAVVKRGGLLRFFNVDPFSRIVGVDFLGDKALFAYDDDNKTVSVDASTPPGYYEYDPKVELSLRDPFLERTVTIVESAEGNSRPGVIVEA